MSGDSIRLRNRSKIVERSLFAIIELLQGTKFIFCTLYGVWGNDFPNKFQILEKKFTFILFHLIFLCYYCCSKNLKRQSELSGLRPDTSSLVFFLETKLFKESGDCSVVNPKKQKTLIQFNKITNCK